MLKLIVILATSQKKLNQVTMIQIDSKKHWVTHELQGTYMSSTKKMLVLTTPKVVLYEWKKRFGKVSLAKNLSTLPSKIQRIMQTHGVHSAILSALVWDSKFKCIPHGLSQDSTNSLIQAIAYFARKNTVQQVKTVDTSWLKSRQ